MIILLPVVLVMELVKLDVINVMVMDIGHAVTALEMDKLGARYVKEKVRFIWTLTTLAQSVMALELMSVIYVEGLDESIVAVMVW